MNGGKPASLEFPVWTEAIFLHATNYLRSFAGHFMHALRSLRNRSRNRNCPWKPENFLAIVKQGTDPVYYGFIGYWATIFLVFWNTEPIYFWSCHSCVMLIQYFLVSLDTGPVSLGLMELWAGFADVAILSWYFLVSWNSELFFWSCGDTEPVFSGLIEFWAGFLVLWRYCVSIFWFSSLRILYFLYHFYHELQ